MQRQFFSLWIHQNTFIYEQTSESSISQNQASGSYRRHYYKSPNGGLTYIFCDFVRKHYFSKIGFQFLPTSSINKPQKPQWGSTYIFSYRYPPDIFSIPPLGRWGFGAFFVLVFLGFSAFPFFLTYWVFDGDWGFGVFFSFFDSAFAFKLSFFLRAFDSFGLAFFLLFSLLFWLIDWKKEKGIEYKGRLKEKDWEDKREKLIRTPHI